MFLSKDLVSRAFHGVSRIGPETGKTRLERISAVSRFFACAELLHRQGTSEIDLATEAPTRAEFITAVGRVLKLEADNIFAPDFVTRITKVDYGAGNNFLTTQVAASQGTTKDYPSRPAPLLVLKDQKATLHTDHAVNLRDRYEWDKVRVDFALWLARSDTFGESEQLAEVADAINRAHAARFGPNVAEVLRISHQELGASVGDLDALLNETPADLSGLGKPQTGGSSFAPVSYEGHGRNLLFYGAPGTGKSHKVDALIEGAQIERTVFHPDTQNNDFFGTLKPRTVGERVYYDFAPGPFAKILKKALMKPDVHFFLVIEELNRAPAAAVFGEVFQLLDRAEDGSSSYEIGFPTPESQAWMAQDGGPNQEMFGIPANLSLLATMNSADQGVYPLDTAFRRRWEQEYLPLYTEACPEGSLSYIDEANQRQHMPWRSFVRCLNDTLLDEFDVSEDRLLGQWFVKERELGGRVPAKILLYLWDDLLRHENRAALFAKNIRTYGELDEALKRDRRVFSVEFLARLGASMGRASGSDPGDGRE